MAYLPPALLADMRQLSTGNAKLEAGKNKHAKKLTLVPGAPVTLPAPSALATPSTHAPPRARPVRAPPLDASTAFLVEAEASEPHGASRNMSMPRPSHRASVTHADGRTGRRPGAGAAAAPSTNVGHEPGQTGARAHMTLDGVLAQAPDPDVDPTTAAGYLGLKATLGAAELAMVGMPRDPGPRYDADRWASESAADGGEGGHAGGEDGLTAALHEGAHHEHPLLAPQPDNPFYVGASTKPVTRREVVQMKNTMAALLTDLGLATGGAYPTSMHAFLSVLSEEQQIYDSAFSELIRQVSINMIERGELLAEIRHRYHTLFERVPRHVKLLHVELVAQRALNKRLTEELTRTRDTLTDIMGEVETIRKHDSHLADQAQAAQEKLTAILSQSDNTEEVLEEYHKLYRMQRSRLEEAIRRSEAEKTMWMTTSVGLALRLGIEHGIRDLPVLQNAEHGRLRAAHNIIVQLSTINTHAFQEMTTKMVAWRERMLVLSQSISNEDINGMDLLSNLQQEFKLVLGNLEDPASMDTSHPLIKGLALIDVRTLAEALTKWLNAISRVSHRFLNETDLGVIEELRALRPKAEAWMEDAARLLRRNEGNANGKDYAKFSEELMVLQEAVEQWIARLEIRITGDDGLATALSTLQNQVEDRAALFMGRRENKPLTASERNQLIGFMTPWCDQVGHIVKLLANNCERDQHRVPGIMDAWATRLADQFSTDTDVRAEENVKLHTSAMAWLVHLVESLSSNESHIDSELSQTGNEIAVFHRNLVRDMGALELKSDENKSLRMVLQNHILLWDRTAKTILSFLRNTRLVNSSGVPRVVGVPMVTIVDDDAPPDEAWARMMDGPGSRSEPSASEPSASEPSASQSSAPPSARSAASSSPQS